jgi:hypothetical protein
VSFGEQTMDFDSYWHDLIDRVYKEQAVLRGAEELVYRLTSIYGETMVDGIEAYFERRYEEYERDINALKENGLLDVAADFDEARQVMFGNLPLTESSITPVLDRLLEENESVESTLEKIGEIYDRLIEKLPRVLDRRDEIGVENGLFQVDAEQ